MKIIAGLLVLMFANTLRAEVHCQIKDRLRCLCHASIMVQCDDGTEGYIDKNTKVSSLTLKTVSDVGAEKSFTVKNPPAGIDTYYNPKDDAWTKSQLSAQGAEHIQDVFGKEFTISHRPAVYDNSKPAMGTSDGNTCFLLKEGVKPNLGKCDLPVSCWKGEEALGDGLATCHAKDSSCPDLQTCLNEPDTNASPSATGSKKSTPGVH